MCKKCFGTYAKGTVFEQSNFNLFQMMRWYNNFGTV